MPAILFITALTVRNVRSLLLSAKKKLGNCSRFTTLQAPFSFRHGEISRGSHRLVSPRLREEVTFRTTGYRLAFAIAVLAANPHQ
jgi:hypothetical protein